MITDYDKVNNLADAAWKSYVLLLRFPITVRIKYQAELVALRDSIAEIMQEEPENIQKTATKYALEIGGII